MAEISIYSIKAIIAVVLTLQNMNSVWVDVLPLVHDFSKEVIRIIAIFREGLATLMADGGFILKIRMVRNLDMDHAILLLVV